MNKKIGLIFVLAILAVATAALLGIVSSIDTPIMHGGNNTARLQDQNQSLPDKIFDRQPLPEIQLKRFKSQDELEEFLKTNAQSYSRGGIGGMKVFATTGSVEASSAVPQASDYSTTNVQVAGVDEADIVKNDGRYIYTLSGNKLVIVDAYPAESAEVVSETTINGHPMQMFVNEDRLVVFSQNYEDYILREETISGQVMPRRPYSGTVTHIYVYDISAKERPALARRINVRGDYRNSRMIGNYVYAIVNQPVYYYGDGPVLLPAIAEDDMEKETAAQDIYYFDYPNYSYSYTNIVALNIQNDNEAYNSRTFLGGSTQNMYVSESNIYLTETVHSSELTFRAATVKAAPQIMPQRPTEELKEETAIRKIAIEDGKIKYKGEGSVPGHVLNQFSMDEHKGYFRIATTTGEVSRFEGGAKSQNHIYVLDESLKVVGSVEDLAPGEKIYSARFMGDRAYMVTFKKVDPLFVIDLSEPTQPRVLGKLKIPGYSDYLHPYDENHIIGLGKEAAEAETGDFAWYQGIKLALFDVSDPENPREVSKYNIGDRGTDSYALQDHKAFLFSRQKNLLVIPVLLAEIDESKYAEGNVPPSAYGDFVWQGAYVFSLDKESGFDLKGRVTHLDTEEGEQKLLKSGYYFSSEYDVKRSLYMDDVLYTLSDRMIKMNDLVALKEVNKVELPK